MTGVASSFRTHPQPKTPCLSSLFLIIFGLIDWASVVLSNSCGTSGFRDNRGRIMPLNNLEGDEDEDGDDVRG